MILELILILFFALLLLLLFRPRGGGDVRRVTSIRNGMPRGHGDY